jgi:exonuclease VII large subunit
MQPISTPSNALSALLSLLDREENHLRDCRAALTRLHASLLRGDEAAAEKARTAVTQAADAVMASARQRSRSIASILGPHGSAKPTLTELISHLDGEDAARLRAKQQAMWKVSAELRQIHQRCTQVLAYSRVFLHRLLRDIVPGSQAGTRYGPNGAARDSQPAAVLVRG